MIEQLYRILDDLCLGVSQGIIITSGHKLNKKGERSPCRGLLRDCNWVFNSAIFCF